MRNDLKGVVLHVYMDDRVRDGRTIIAPYVLVDHGVINDLGVCQSFVTFAQVTSKHGSTEIKIPLRDTNAKVLAVFAHAEGKPALSLWAHDPSVPDTELFVGDGDFTLIYPKESLWSE